MDKLKVPNPGQDPRTTHLSISVTITDILQIPSYTYSN